MKKLSKGTFVFLILLLVGFFANGILMAFFVMFFDGPATFGLEEKMIESQITAFFPAVLIADIIFLLLYTRFKKLYFGLIIIVIPAVVVATISYHFKHGYLPKEDLPIGDYRHFRGTEAYCLISEIIEGRPLLVFDSSTVNFHEPNSGMTPLLFCIGNKYYKRAEELLTMGADPNEVNRVTSESPLWALSKSILNDTLQSSLKIQLLSKLLENGANTNHV